MSLSWFASPGWDTIVKALLDTLWQGAVIAVLLALALRRIRQPVARYRGSLGALAGVMLAGLVTWAVLNRPAAQPASNIPIAAKQSVAALAKANSVPASPPHTPDSPSSEPETVGTAWTAWLGLVWVAGVMVMLGRAGMQMAGAERLRRTSRLPADARLAELLAEARRAMGLARRVRLAMTEKLTSPAVVGVLVPTLIIPLSLTTTLTPDQIRFVLLHELAHIRRGDYFVNLFQLFAEALLFFNPAVWWISRQVRIEREACCDALAVELSGAPADYARTLVHVAESVLHPAPVAAPALGGRRGPSSLADRIQRMLVPGYRPRLRLTWRAMLVALLTGGALLVLSALGTRATVAAILSPQQRIARIEKKMAEYGQPPGALHGNVNGGRAARVNLSGRVRMADGSKVPAWIQLNLSSYAPRSSYIQSGSARHGRFSEWIRAGTIYIDAELTNCAPAFIGPLDGFATNRFEHLDLVCRRGFDVPLQLLDGSSGEPVTPAKAATTFWMNRRASQPHAWKADENGRITLTHCADLPLEATVNAPGYLITTVRFDHVHPGEPLRVELRRGETVSGRVVDAVTGKGLDDATLQLLHQTGRTEVHHNWSDPIGFLAKTGADGRFVINQLGSGEKYWIGVSAPAHESVIVPTLEPETEKTVIKLGPELVVRGRIIGNSNALRKIENDGRVDVYTSEVFGNHSYGNSELVPVFVTNGMAAFQFTNRAPGKISITLAGRTFERNVTDPANWTIDLNSANSPVRPREVILRFRSRSGVAPRGTVYVTVPSRMDAGQPGYERKEFEIQNGEARARTFVGAFLDYQPARTIGFWFREKTVPRIDAGAGPLVIDVPVIPAGAVYARARNADGSPAGGLFFQVEEVKRSPERDKNSPLSDNMDSISGNKPRKWISGPLPLGGTYRIIGWRGNSFCASKPVQLTESHPDAEVELQFSPGTSFTGVVLGPDGLPVRGTEVGVQFATSRNHSFSLKSVFTDSRGQFRVDDATPGIGNYTLTVSSPGCRAERFDVDFSRLPLELRLKRGRELAGRVVEAGTGYVIPDAKVRAWTGEGKLPEQSTRTDGDGRFAFTTLGDAAYRVYVDGANFAANANNEFKAGRTNLLLEVTPYQGSRLRPRASEGAK